MELELKIIGVDGTVRAVTVNPGESVEIQPGETIIVAPDQNLAVTTTKEGETLVVQTPAGDISLQGFYLPTNDQQLPTALVYEDDSGLHLLFPQGEQTSQSFTIQALSAVRVPEALELAEQVSLPGYAQRAAAFRAISRAG